MPAGTGQVASVRGHGDTARTVSREQDGGSASGTHRPAATASLHFFKKNQKLKVL